MKMTVIPIVISTLGTVIKVLVQRLEDLKIRGRVATTRVTALLRLAKNTEKSPGDLRRLAVAQTQMKRHQPTLMWKTFKREKKYNKKEN